MIDAIEVAADIEGNGAALIEARDKIEGFLCKVDIALSAPPTEPDGDPPISEDIRGKSVMSQDILVDLREEVAVSGVDICVGSRRVAKQSTLLLLFLTLVPESRPSLVEPDEREKRVLFYSLRVSSERYGVLNAQWLVEMRVLLEFLWGERPFRHAAPREGAGTPGALWLCSHPTLFIREHALILWCAQYFEQVVVYCLLGYTHHLRVALDLTRSIGIADTILGQSSLGA